MGFPTKISWLINLVDVLLATGTALPVLEKISGPLDFTTLPPVERASKGLQKILHSSSAYQDTMLHIALGHQLTFAATAISFLVSRDAESR